MADREAINSKDYFYALASAGAVFAYYWWGIGALEYFRHTEADRTLIAWEMQDSGSYLTPHLIGSPIFTKPPMFYWLIAAFIEYFQSAEVAIVRLPSLIFASLFCACQFLFLRHTGFNRKVSLGGTAMLAFGAIFFVHAPQAEIDMVFTVWCWLALILVFVAHSSHYFLSTLFSYFFAGLAFLTKGPPAIIFLIPLHGFYHLWLIRFRARDPRWWPFLRAQIAGVLLFVALVAIWMSALISQVGEGEIVRWFEVEFLSRIVDESTHKRGLFYYWPLIVESSLPWSLSLVSALGLFLCSARARESFKKVFNSRQGEFFAFNVMAVALIVVLLSLSQGKSTRYFLPAYVFCSNLCLCSFLLLADSTLARPLRRCFGAICALTSAGLAVSGWLFPGVLSLFGFGYWGLGTGCFAGLLLSGALLKKTPPKSLTIGAIALLLIVVRFNYIYGYAPMRNAKYSVIPIAQEINRLLPKDVPVYNLELFERWITYYLKVEGRNSYRLDPSRKSQLLNSAGDIFVLLNEEEEYWRLDILQEQGINFEILKHFTDTANPVLLIRIPAVALAHWGVHEHFPTVPSPARSI